jgi:hypothetical protein
MRSPPQRSETRVCRQYTRRHRPVLRAHAVRLDLAHEQLLARRVVRPIRSGSIVDRHPVQSPTCPRPRNACASRTSGTCRSPSSTWTPTGTRVPAPVADLPTPAWPAGGPNGVWIVNNQCTGDNCHLDRLHRSGAPPDLHGRRRRIRPGLYHRAPLPSRSTPPAPPGRNTATTSPTPSTAAARPRQQPDFLPRPGDLLRADINPALQLFGTDITGRSLALLGAHSSRPVVGFRAQSGSTDPSRRWR